MPSDDLKAQLETSEQEKAELTEKVQSLEAALAKASEEASEARKRSSTSDTDEGGDDDSAEARKGEIDKSHLTPEVRALVEKAEKDATEATAKAAAAEALAKEERDRRLDREYLAKAESFKFLGADTGELAPLLKSANATLGSEQYEKLEGILRAADEQIRQGDLFKQMGTDQGGGEPTDALMEVTRKAEELRKSDDSLSMEKAMERVMTEDKALQQRYLAEVR